MPSTYAHYRLGKEVLPQLSESVRALVEKYRGLYDIGLHGGDICLYYEPMSFNAVKKTCFAVHKEYGDELFERMIPRIETAPDPEAFKAYLIGVVCHYALDKVCHPYVEKVNSLQQVGHTELETDLDRNWMIQDGLDPMKHFPILHIDPSQFHSQIIQHFYDNLTVQEVQDSLQGMIDVTKFFHAPTEERLQELYQLLRDNNCFGPMHGLIMKANQSQYSPQYYPLFQRLYDEAVPLAVKLIGNFVDHLETGAAYLPEFHFTFGPGESWEDLEV